MELAPRALNPDISPPTTEAPVTGVEAAPSLGVGRTAVLGALGTAGIVVGSLLGGQSFETHLPGAWFFGMPGGALGWMGTNSTLPPVISLALVFGGLILLTRVWLGFLRVLKANEGFPVKRVVLVVMVLNGVAPRTLGPYEYGLMWWLTISPCAAYV